MRVVEVSLTLARHVGTDGDCEGSRRCVRDSSTHRYLHSSSYHNNSGVNSVSNCDSAAFWANCAEARGDPTGADLGQGC